MLVVSCRPSNTWNTASISERRLDFPAGIYDHIISIENQIIGFAHNRLSPEQRIIYAYEEDKTFTRFFPEVDPNCLNYSLFLVVSILPDGRLGLLKERDDGSAATTYQSTNRSIYAYDWQTGELERLVDGKLTGGSDPKFFTWNTDMTLGVQETNSGWQGTIYWIKPEGMSPMDIEVEVRGLEINLKDHLDGKEHTGLVGSPAWSPDGKTIAFFVTTYGIREDPLPKYNVVYDLFFMNPSTLKPIPELMDVADAGKIVWSLNNEYLLFTGCIGRGLTCGLWWYKISDKALYLIKEGSFADYIWVADDRIIVIKNIDLSYDYNEVWEYTILE
jgi:hypothetical protein